MRLVYSSFGFILYVQLLPAKLRNIGKIQASVMADLTMFTNYHDYCGNAAYQVERWAKETSFTITRLQWDTFGQCEWFLEWWLKVCKSSRRSLAVLSEKGERLLGDVLETSRRRVSPTYAQAPLWPVCFLAWQAAKSITLQISWALDKSGKLHVNKLTHIPIEIGSHVSWIVEVRNFFLGTDGRVSI